MNDRRKDWRRNFFGDIFNDFDREYERMRHYMDSMFERSLQANRDEKNRPKPFVYGFSIKMGPDGLPHVQEFGNTKNSLRNMKTLEEGLGREPLTDIIEKEKSVSITAELPGVEKKDINVDLREKKLSIKVDTELRKYHKDISLPEDVDPKSVSATYKNGVLDISVDRKEPPKPKSRKIDIN
jgi:HSP20 family protein